MDTYKFHGHKDADNGINTLVAEGTADDPVRYAEKGQAIELSDEEVETYRGQGLKLVKASDADTQVEIDEKSDAPVEADGAQHPTYEATTEITPGGRTATGSKKN